MLGSEGTRIFGTGGRVSRPPCVAVSPIPPGPASPGSSVTAAVYEATPGTPSGRSATIRCVTIPVVGQLWREQSVWSGTANRMKQRIERARVAALVLVVLVAICGTTAAALAPVAADPARWLAATAAIGSAVLPLLRPAWSGARLRDWTRARSVSEALKSDVYLWLARAGDYTDDADAALLTERTDLLRTDAADLLPQRHGIEPEHRAVPEVTDLHSYFAVRVGGQIDRYYQPRSDRIRVVLGRFRVVEVALGLSGALLGGIAAVAGAALAAWIAVIATIGAGLAAHVAAARYEFQLVEFLRTAERLRQLRRAAERPGCTDAERDVLAVRAEDVVSVENQGWMAKLAEDPPNHVTRGTG